MDEVQGGPKTSSRSVQLVSVFSCLLCVAVDCESRVMRFLCSGVYHVLVVTQCMCSCVDVGTGPEWEGRVGVTLIQKLFEF